MRNTVQPAPANASLTGVVDRIVYRSEESGFTVMSVKPRSPVTQAYLQPDGTVAVVGVLIEFNPGEVVRLRGSWVTDKRYGNQFKVNIIEMDDVHEEAGLIAFLSGLVSGVGKKTAERIVNHFGSETVAVLSDSPERLNEIMRPTLAAELAEAWAENFERRRVLISLLNLGMTPKMAERIFETYGARAVKVIRLNPYILADEVEGIGFVRADAMARNMGFELDDPNRLRAALNHTLKRMLSSGHVYLPRQELVSQTVRLMGVSDSELVDTLLEGELVSEALMADENILDDDLAVYLPAYFDAEMRVTVALKNLIDTQFQRHYKAMDDAQSFSSRVRHTVDMPTVNLSADQLEAVEMALNNKVAIMTGGPGTGKTSALRALIEKLEDEDLRFLLVSPTGRAAKRLSEATGYSAFTIHRALGYTIDQTYFHDENNPLPIDFLIIDEASMLDIDLFRYVLDALKPTSRLFIVGDVDQLPSVGPGNVLGDLIASGLIPVKRLTDIFRQGEGSGIIRNAHRINQGQELEFNRDQDFFFFDAQEPAAAAELIVDIVKNRLPAKFGFDPYRDVQVLSPMYRHEIGVTALNSALQQALNSGFAPQVNVDGLTLKLYDKVIQTRNNYELEVYNGDVGVITDIDMKLDEVTVQFEGSEVTYERRFLNELQHAYCISTHRSQGSEYPVVVMPVMTQHYAMLQRNLLYTAVTRARSMVVLVGMRRAVQVAIQNDRIARRYSGLLTRLKMF
jgi:exodeoxyribonuclease V alpha subunit